MLETMRSRFRLNAKRSARISALPVQGHVKVRGTVHPKSVILRSPISGRSCVFYRLELHEWENGTKLPLLIETSDSLFRIDDESGSVLIDPSKVDCNLLRGLMRGHSSDYVEQHREVLRRHNLTTVDLYGERRSLSFSESIIAAGETVSAIGTIRREADPRGAAHYREQPQKIILGADDEYSLLLSN